MKKNVFILALFCCLTVMAQAQVAKYCMTYADFVAGKWNSVDELTKGRQACQIKTDNKQVRFKTGDKAADKMLKKEAFAVMYGDQLFVNCRNLRCNDICLDVLGYTQAVRYDNDKICVMAYKCNDAAFVLELGTAVAGCLVDSKALSAGLWVTSGAIGFYNENMKTMACYLVDGSTTEKGKINATRINDSFMESLLASDAPLLEKYKAISGKRSRQSAANVLPILMEKGVVAMHAVN